jgi:hypothetical protein
MNVEDRSGPCWPELGFPRAPGDDVAAEARCRAWVIARGRISGLLLALRHAEVEVGAALPLPLAGGAALRAWAVVCSGRDTATARVALALVGEAARVLGTGVCRLRSGGTDDVVTKVLEQEATVHGCTPERLVAELARAHGVLAAPDRVSAALVWRAIEDSRDE